VDVLRLKRNVPYWFFALFLLACLAVPLAAAHAPLDSGDNESLETATVISDPTKSWVIYTSLHDDGHPQYYTFNLSDGENLVVSLFKSTQSKDADFKPALIIIGPNVTASDEVPPDVEIPPNTIARLVESEIEDASFEPFSPGTLINLGSVREDDPAAGQYWLVVYEQSNQRPQGGNYGLAIGARESFTVDEWLLIPFDLVGIYQWEGQSLALILAPMAAALAVGVIFTGWVLRRQRWLSSPFAWLAAIAGFSFIGTAAMTLMQLIIAATLVEVGLGAILTVVFAVIPLVLGVLTVRLALSGKPVTVRQRVYLAVLGVGALVFWAGYIVGPALAIASSVMPTMIHRRNRTHTA
jgi:hypothetical protein